VSTYDSTKELLEKISPTMCAAKWNQPTLHLHNGQTHSCHHPNTHPIHLGEIKDDPAALVNSGYLKTQRREMVEGKRPQECNYCWNIENTNGISDRVLKSKYDTPLDKLNELVNTDPEQLYTKNFNPTYIEISFDYTCNLKCAYCGPTISSAWHQEILEHGGYPTTIPHYDLESYKSKLPILKRDHNPYVDAFWKWFPELKNDLKILRVTGGEPLLSKDMWKLFDNLIEGSNTDMTFAVNTNLMQDRDIIDKLINRINKLEGKVRNFELYTSIDTGIAKHAEYIRYGLDYNIFQSNLERVLDEVKWPIKVSNMCTVTNLSSVGLKDIIRYFFLLRGEYAGTHKVANHNSYLRYPNWLDLRVGRDTSIHYLEKTKKYYEKIMIENKARDIKSLKIDFLNGKSVTFPGNEDYDLSNIFPYWSKNDMSKQIDRLIGFAKIPLPESQETVMHRDFYKFWTEYDRRKGTDFCKTFPEFADFYHKCKQL
jgi:hypothetical protein